MSEKNEILTQLQQLTLMQLDGLVRITAVEKVLFEKGTVLPGEYQEIVKAISDEIGKNLEDKMAELVAATEKADA